MSTAQPESPDRSESAPASTKPPKPPRSRAEQLVVRGLIGALLVVVAIEGWSYFSFKMAHSRLMSDLERSENSDYRLTKERVAELVRREPDWSRSIKVAVGEETCDVYLYKGLIKERPLCVRYGVQGRAAKPEVIEVLSIIPDELL